MRTAATERARLSEIEGLYRQRYRGFLRFALALLGDPELARDAVQEAFARAVRSRSNFRGDGSLEAWLYGTLANHCRDLLRASQRSRRVAVDLVQPNDSGHGNGVPDDSRELRAAVAALPERQRLILFLRHYADLDYEAIASALGIRRGTVAAALHTAHGALRQTLKEEAR
jgi:RNA polymerase sigma-70 factor (ECF subfamily)